MTAERRRCVCRGELEADPSDELEVEQAVRQHQQTLTHIVWRAGDQLRRSGTMPAGAPVTLATPQLRRVG